MDRGQPWGVGDWCWHSRLATPCRILDRQEMWGDVAYRVWLPTKDAVIRVRSQDLGSLDGAEPTVNQILHTAAAAKLLDALEDNLLLAPMQSSVVPLPHQLHALNRAIGGSGGGRIRFLLADEVGLGKTVEAGLILRELKLRGLARRILVVAPKGLVRQWQAEMRLHFGESFRLMQLLDRESFPDEGSVTRERVRRFVIRTEKREAIDAEGQPLFRPRMTRLQAVAWQPRHQAQRRLYDAVTDYVRHGWNQAMANQQRHVGFLMILMQRLVTSSTAAIRTTLEKRLAVLRETPVQASLLDGPDLGSPGVDDWAELDGQAQVDIAIQAASESRDGLAREQAEVGVLLELARETEAAGTDAKAEALLELIYALQQEEGDPLLKVLVFTEFVPTQRMLADYLETRGFSIALINGGMDLDERARAQRAFAEDARVMISTDAGGEGLNLQFCHVIVNFDMPWNPMRVEQRIGRVDRIGQRHVVRATNFVIEDTVELRVRQVLEEKLALIAKELGVDKAADVMDSVDTEPLFDALYLSGIQDPASIDRECDAVLDRIRDKMAESRMDSALLAEGQVFSADDARRWRDHPAQFWLERAITTGLRARGGDATREGPFWRLRWLDGSESSPVCFDARTAQDHPEAHWLTLEDPRTRALIGELPRYVVGQPLAQVRIDSLPETVAGVWSLWEIALFAEDFSRKRFLPVFVNDQGRTFMPTARRIWDLLLTEEIRVVGLGRDVDGDAQQAFGISRAAATSQGEQIFAGLLESHRQRIREARERARDAFDSRWQALGRIGLPEVRAYRRRRLEQEHALRMASLDDAEASIPELEPLMMLRLGPVPGSSDMGSTERCSREHTGRTDQGDRR